MCGLSVHTVDFHIFNLTVAVQAICQGCLTAGGEWASACGQVSSADWLGTCGLWAFSHVKIQLQ